MKKIFFLSALLSFSLAQAAEVTVLDKVMPQITRLDSVSAEYRIDVNRADASVSMVVKSLESIGYPGGVSVRTTKYKIEVPELELVNDDVVLSTPEGEVTCGTMGTTPVLKRPVLKLNGNCGLITTVTRTPEGRRVQVKIVTE